KTNANKPIDELPETISLLGDKNANKEKSRLTNKAERTSDQATILAEAMAATKAGKKEKATMLWDVYLSITTASMEPSKIVPSKHAREEEVVVLQEGELDFAVNEINSHKDDKAIIHWVEKRPKSEETGSENRNRYTGLPYPSEWTQTFSEWTTNHQGLYIALRDVYHFRTFAGWVLVHKSHRDKILARHGFMAALRYDVNVRWTVFAHRVMVNGRPSVADISVFRQDIAEETYSDARNFGEIGMTDNPYAENGTRAGWDPLTGAQKPQKAYNQKQGYTRAPEDGDQPNQPGAKSQRTSGYKGKNFNPKYKEQKAATGNGGGGNTAKGQDSTP
ncbi:hypothetical protein PTTG_30447, partial [Puccinia triticina 1-1 BBBD Race 1]